MKIDFFQALVVFSVLVSRNEVPNLFRASKTRNSHSLVLMNAQYPQKLEVKQVSTDGSSIYIRYLIFGMARNCEIRGGGCSDCDNNNNNSNYNNDNSVGDDGQLPACSINVDGNVSNVRAFLQRLHANDDDGSDEYHKTKESLQKAHNYFASLGCFETPCVMVSQIERKAKIPYHLDSLKKAVVTDDILLRLIELQTLQDLVNRCGSYEELVSQLRQEIKQEQSKVTEFIALLHSFACGVTL